jgi:hypothetical protein
MYNGQIINLLEYQDAQQFIKRAIMLLEKSQASYYQIMIKNTLTR